MLHQCQGTTERLQTVRTCTLTCDSEGDSQAASVFVIPGVSLGPALVDVRTIM